MSARYEESAAYAENGASLSGADRGPEDFL